MDFKLVIFEFFPIVLAPHNANNVGNQSLHIVWQVLEAASLGIHAGELIRRKHLSN